MEKRKTLQKSSKNRIKADKKMTPKEVLEFLDEFQQVVQGQEGKRKLISLRVPENLLEQFRFKSKKNRIPYQSQIVELMRNWLKE